MTERNRTYRITREGQAPFTLLCSGFHGDDERGLIFFRQFLRVPDPTEANNHPFRNSYENVTVALYRDVVAVELVEDGPVEA